MVDAAEQLDWSTLLADQVDRHWRHQARPRLDGLTDDEYRWEPVPGAWNVRPRGSGAPAGSVEVGAGAGVIDYAFPEPSPTPFTTIAWRLCHVLVGVLAERNARYFGGPPTSYDSHDYPLTAARAVAELDDAYVRWVEGVRTLDDDGLRARCREPGFERDSMAGLVLHIHRELVHHLAEVALLRYLWLHRPGAGRTT